MKKLIVYHGDSPVQVEGFPKECARSCEGALHIHPGKHKTVTDGEYSFMKDKYSHVMPKLKVVAEIGEKEIEAEKKNADRLKAKAEGKSAPAEEKPEAQAEGKEAASAKEESTPLEKSSEDGGKKAKSKKR